MKMTIIGGAGARVPLLTNGMLQFRQDLKTDQLALWDVDSDRRKVTATICRGMCERLGASLEITSPASLDEALEDADFVICSIRVDGLGGRIQDERIALENNTLGQETVGAGGFALALRTIPVLLDYARQVQKRAPRAWLVNFTNPVGIMSQALLADGLGERTIGICDTPREQFEHIGHAMGAPIERAFFDYLGLNHLGWVRRVLVDGFDRMPELLEDRQRLERVYKMPFFNADFLQELGLFPTEYLYFYYFPREALAQTRSSGGTRGELIARLEKDLMRTVSANPDDHRAALKAYDRYLASRNATYMSIETGGQVSEEAIRQAQAELYQGSAGYDRIAIDVIRGILGKPTPLMPLNVRNNGSIEDFEDLDAVEVPCALDSNGPHPISTGKLPGAVRELALRVKEYERLTVKAALEGSARWAEEALATNPIIESRDQARSILEAYRAAHSTHLAYLR